MTAGGPGWASAWVREDVGHQGCPSASRHVREQRRPLQAPVAYRRAPAGSRPRRHRGLLRSALVARRRAWTSWRSSPREHERLRLRAEERPRAPGALAGGRTSRRRRPPRRRWRRRLRRRRRAASGSPSRPGSTSTTRATADRGRCRQARPLLDRGVDWVVLALDDIPNRAGLAAEQADLVSWLVAAAAHGRLTLVPTEYVGTHPSATWPSSAGGLPARVELMWTGPTVCSPDHRRRDGAGLAPRDRGPAR